ncbi:exodeoxyribonuclease III [Williamsia sterculiae]|uniref:Exodeoxyribonuclease-3 n=1 Tax=Williamsia sterculiae TaxID=1344003 RepID=A0A1N7DWK8_9NOCA|nr:exodeoxyribonuclease III [Williamsia sterculiae]SIR80200.1 exodeoxyribonuclease-3 [Williamsia sterculiae]
MTDSGTTGDLTITTVNVNGIRAAVKQRNDRNHGFLRWLRETSSDVVLLQEVRATAEQAHEALAPALESGRWHLTTTESTVKGHAGVGVLSRRPPIATRVGFGSDEFDGTGRYLEVDWAGDRPLTAASVYVPKGAADGEKRDDKFRFLAGFAEYLSALNRRRRDVVVAGDWNIAPAELDIKNWKGNLKSPGFLPEERAWVAELLASGWRDVARELTGDESGPYSWWSWRGKAFDNDSGWRIDYHLANRRLGERAIATSVDRAAAYDLRWSDHAPVTVRYAP